LRLLHERVHHGQIFTFELWSKHVVEAIDRQDIIRDRAPDQRLGAVFLHFHNFEEILLSRP
jgi:hypothetical protein